MPEPQAVIDAGADFAELTPDHAQVGALIARATGRRHHDRLIDRLLFRAVELHDRIEEVCATLVEASEAWGLDPNVISDYAAHPTDENWRSAIYHIRRLQTRARLEQVRADKRRQQEPESVSPSAPVIHRPSTDAPPVPATAPAVDTRSTFMSPEVVGMKVETCLFRDRGHGWQVAFFCESKVIKGSLGMQHYGRLLRTPNPAQPITAFDLMGIVRPPPVDDVASPQEAIDDEAYEEYRARLEEIEKELGQSHALSEAQHQELLREKEFLAKQFARDMGMTGHHRAIGPANAKVSARNAVGQALKRARDELAKNGLSHLAEHLKNYVRPEGYAFAYRPPQTPPAWILD